MGFIYPCIDQLVNHASRLRNRTQGRLSCPFVLRVGRMALGSVPLSITRRPPKPCSLIFRAYALSFRPRRNAPMDLLLAAIRDPDPVVFLEPTRIYQPRKGSGRRTMAKRCHWSVAFVLREGRDVSLISWGAMLKETLAAADKLAAEGIAAEVIDLATLKPYDEETVLASVTKTGRCVIVHEAARTGGFGAKIAAVIAERGLLSLLAPVARITGYDTIIPLPRLEQHYMPSVGRIVMAAHKVCQFS